MERIKQWRGLAAGLGFLVLIFDSRTALAGARSGMELCLKTVIPSLFPFFVLSILMTDTLAKDNVSRQNGWSKRLGLPAAAEPLLVPAFLGGYPVGAECVGQLYQIRQLSKETAEGFLSFCSNAGPSFLFGIVSAFFPDIRMVWALWGIHIVGALLTAWTVRLPQAMPSNRPSDISNDRQSVLSKAIRAMVFVCAWIILFRTGIGFLHKWILWRLSAPVQVLVTGLLELANGCTGLASVEDLSVRFVLCSCMLAFGGICVILQTSSVTAGLSLRYYFQGKLLHTGYSFLLSCAIAGPGKGLWLVLLVGTVLFLRKLKNRDSISVPVAV